MRTLLLGFVGVAGLLFLIVLSIGLTRPRQHIARCRATLPQSPERIWQVVSDFANWPRWNPGVKKMERQEDRSGHPVWMNTGAWGPMPMEVTVWEPPRLLQTQVDAGSFRGRWTYEINAADGSTAVTITEEGEVDNPLLRGLMLFHDNHATAKLFLKALGTQFNEEVEPEVVPLTP